MIGTIRKHSTFLWWTVGGLTVISFIWWGASVPTRGGNGAVSAGNFGSIYGKKVTLQEYTDAQHEFYLFYWLHNRDWPTKMSRSEIDREIYIRLMLFRKAEQLGIHVGEQAVGVAGADILRSISGNGRNVSLADFEKTILGPENLTTEDFERFARHDLVIQELIQTMGLPGALITPQEAAADWQHEHQERTAQAVFFSATNYLPQVVVTPAAIAQFYSNNMAVYREPERVQVNYVEFNLSNYLAKAEKELVNSNFDSIVDANYQRLGPDYFPDAKTPEAAKAKIREELIRQRAGVEARLVANQFANAVVDLTNSMPTRAANLAMVAKQGGLTVHATAPFASEYGPAEFLAPQAFTKSAFALTPDEPFAGPISGSTAYYEIALAKRLPERNPAARLDPRPRDTGFQDGTGQVARPARRNQFGGQTDHGAGRRSRIRGGLCRLRSAARAADANFVKHAGIAARTRRARQPSRISSGACLARRSATPAVLWRRRTADSLFMSKKNCRRTRRP